MRMSQSGLARGAACAVFLVAATACARGPLGTGVPGGDGGGAAVSARTPADAGVGSLRPRTPVRSEPRSLQFGGLRRTYRVYRPATADRSRPVPLVLVLHGGLGTGAQAEQAYGWDAEADRGGFVVVYPDGVGHTWNAGICCGPAARRRIDDLGFLRSLLGVLQRNEGIDPGRIAATGISNGGLMDYVLACRLPGRLAAIGPVAATQPEPCPAARGAARPRPTSVLHIHGLDDHYIPFAGGPGTKGLAASRIDWPPVQDVIEAWRQMDGCGAPVVRVEGSVTRSTSACADASAVALVTIRGAGHQWPGAAPPRLPFLDPPSTALDATSALGAFFAAHPLAGS